MMNIGVTPLPQILIDAAWAQLHQHADDLVTGACRYCWRTTCLPYRRARAELAMAGEIDFDPIRDLANPGSPALTASSAEIASAGIEAAGWGLHRLRPAAPNNEIRREARCVTTSFSGLSLRAATPMTT